MPKEETKETETVSPEPVEEDFVSEIEEAESSIQKEIAEAQKFEKELDVLQKKMAQNVQDLQEEKNEAEKTKVFDKADLDQIQQVEANPSSEDTESAEESEQEEADIETDVETDAEINNDIETDIAYDTEESENVDSEEAETFFEEEEEDEDDEEWETSADNFVASLLKTGAKLTNTSEPVIREEEETTSETVESESENQNIEDESVETDSSKAFSEETESYENESAEAEPSKDDSAEIDEEESLEESEDESLTDEVADYIENSDNSDDDNSDDAVNLEEDSKEEAASDLVEESLSDEYSQDEYSEDGYSEEDYAEDDYQKEDDSFEDENDSKTENQNESLVKSMPRATLVDDSVYEYEKAIIDDLKQEDVSRYVDVDEETYEEVKKKKHHIVPIVILVLVSSIALAAAILAATGHLGEFVNALNEQFSSGNQPDAEESAKLPEKSSDKSLEENTEKEHSSEVKSSETQTSSETAPSSSADDNLENNNENNQTSQNTAADTAAVSDSAEITSSAGSTEPSSLKEESSTQEKSVDEAETESESEAETEKESQTEYESETELERETESQTEKESETETKTASTEQEKTSLEQTETSTQDAENKIESESESERETETESQTESESEVETETESEVESEMETEAESESEEDNTNPYHEAAKAKYPTFSNESYTPIPAVSSGCIYAKYTNFDEAFQTLYTNQSDLSGAAQVALNTPGFNIIGYRVYMFAYQDGILNAYSTQLDGTDLQLSAANVGTEAYIMNGSIFSENREYSMTGDPVGTAYPYIKRFLTFGEDKVYYLDTDGDITRSDYQHTAIQRLELGIDDGNDVAWAQVMGPYLIYYDTKTELMYSCNLDVGTIVLLDFDGVSDPSGLCGNGNWVYGLYDGKLAKVRPNGSELQTIYEPDDSLELVSVEHAMENYIILTAKNTANIKTSAENNSADSNARIKTYCYNLQTGELTQLSAE